MQDLKLRRIFNPPYMEMDKGASASARPIYQYFIQTAKKLKPRFASFITPTRWFAGGKGLDEYRDEMLNDQHISVLHDYLNPEAIFPNTNIRGGVCYFLWDAGYDNGTGNQVKVVTHYRNGEQGEANRPMKIRDVDVFVRNSKGLPILDKIFPAGQETDSMANHISAAKAFGLRTYFAAVYNF